MLDFSDRGRLNRAGCHPQNSPPWFKRARRAPSSIPSPTFAFRPAVHVLATLFGLRYEAWAPVAHTSEKEAIIRLLHLVYHFTTTAPFAWPGTCVPLSHPPCLAHLSRIVLAYRRSKSFPCWRTGKQCPLAMVWLSLSLPPINRQFSNWKECLTGHSGERWSLLSLC